MFHYWRVWIDHVGIYRTWVSEVYYKDYGIHITCIKYFSVFYCSNDLLFLFQVNEAESDRISTQDYHLASSKAYEAATRKVKSLEKELKRHIAKSRPYFDAKAKFDQLLDEEKTRVLKLEGGAHIHETTFTCNVNNRMSIDCVGEAK